MWKYIRTKLGIYDVEIQLERLGIVLSQEIERVRRQMDVDYAALNRTLVEINESGNKIATVIQNLVNANAEGRQNEVNNLVNQLAPAADFLRALAATPTPQAVAEGEVVPPLPPVGGEQPPAEDQAVQDQVAQQEQQFGPGSDDSRDPSGL